MSRHWDKRHDRCRHVHIMRRHYRYIRLSRWALELSGCRLHSWQRHVYNFRNGSMPAAHRGTNWLSAYILWPSPGLRGLYGISVRFKPRTAFHGHIDWRFLILGRLANACSMATLTEQTTELVANFYDPPQPLSNGTRAGINVFLICLTTVSHCFGVRVRLISSIVGSRLI